MSKTFTKRQERTVLALQTANNWSIDTGNGRALLILGTTRTVHSEEHRQNCIKDIKEDIAWNENWTGTPDEVNDPQRDIPRLQDLLALVEKAKIKEEWISDRENLRINDILYNEGKL